eukprot:5147201-Pyramimonas_sp.AAC.1
MFGGISRWGRAPALTAPEFAWANLPASSGSPVRQQSLEQDPRQRRARLPPCSQVKTPEDRVRARAPARACAQYGA